MFIKNTTESLNRAYISIRYYAELGDPDFQCSLALYYDSSNDIQTVVPHNDETCFYWHKKAADQGHESAQFCVGSMLYEGIGCERNRKEGIAWLRKAKEQGDLLAKFYLEDLGLD